MDFIKKYSRFNLWKNKKSGCYECFWPGVNPNDLVEKQEAKAAIFSTAQNKVKNRKKNKSIVINNRYTEMRY